MYTPRSNKVVNYFYEIFLQLVCSTALHRRLQLSVTHVLPLLCRRVVWIASSCIMMRCAVSALEVLGAQYRHHARVPLQLVSLELVRSFFLSAHRRQARISKGCPLAVLVPDHRLIVRHHQLSHCVIALPAQQIILAHHAPCITHHRHVDIAI